MEKVELRCQHTWTLVVARCRTLPASAPEVPLPVSGTKKAKNKEFVHVAVCSPVAAAV